MGPTNLLKPVIERNFGGTVYFGRVTVKIGKPTFATIPSRMNGKAWEEAHFCVTREPASALLIFYVLLFPR